ncbi:D-threonine aldolase [Paenibacillus solanacearum]|uniref:D-threonine aldolase n=1 Tax=Paenibacillus solanacearum TaxID=2048548 RepID=A0A916K8X9_9BACL|nr:alanine racemase [Paenibacillus solanacearum]CAG7646314.1 D-threonine aldolase [Paenibacillus solanacearum]
MSSNEQWESPSVLIDLDILDRNLKETAASAARAGVKLRPHTKTHKSVWIASEQLRYGAAGITVAKLGEAEVMAEGGINDILIAFPVIGQSKLERLGRLMEKAKVTLSTDDEEVARQLSSLGRSLNRDIPLYVDVNTGLNRCGREPGEETAELVKQIAQLPYIRIAGLMTHAGHAYGHNDASGIREVAKKEAESLIMTKHRLEKDGIPIEEISVGSTPTSKYVADIAGSGVTEIRPGAYVFGDGGQWKMGLIGLDQLAMTIAATVVGRPRQGTIIIDAGSKTLSSDMNKYHPGYGILLGHEGAVIERLSEEHGIISVPDNEAFKIGQEVRIVPNHCCVVTNLHDRLVGVRNGRFEKWLPVDARGKVQ